MIDNKHFVKLRSRSNLYFTNNLPIYVAQAL